jgi:glycosyltransferase involved in cell wall biosynthesis
VYRPGGALDRLVKALGEQELDPALWEAIFVLDGHQPEAEALIRNADSGPFRVEVLPQHLGAYAARNRGLLQAHAEKFAFTDADCQPDPRWLQAGLLALNRSPRVAGAIDVEVSGKKRWVEQVDRSRFLRQASYVDQGFAATANLFVLKGVFDRVGNFPENLVSGGDQVWGRQAQRAGFPIRYEKTARVVHPARRTWSALSRKAHRVGKGMGQAVAQGWVNERALKNVVQDRLGLAWGRGDKGEADAASWTLRGAHLGLAAMTAVGFAQGYFWPQHRGQGSGG